jgi:thymidylate synthase ThyX
MFSDREKELLTAFTTNLDSSVFGLINLPEVVKGALFSRYSRSSKSLRRILLDEFLKNDELGIMNDGAYKILNSIQNTAFHEQNNSLFIPHHSSLQKKAEEFYDRVLIGYGDDSVAELGGAHIACEGISNIAAKALEDSRIGISPLEKSTRYVAFDKKINGRYLYYLEPTIMASGYGELYQQTLDALFDTYSQLINPLWQWIQAHRRLGESSLQELETSERAYKSATKAQTLDLLRGLLPMATLTNVGLFGNGRAFEYLLIKLQASPIQENQKLAVAMQRELDKIIPSFVKRAKSERGKEYVEYLRNLSSLIPHPSSLIPPINPTPSHIKLIEFDREAEIKVVAAILYPHSVLGFDRVLEYAQSLSTSDRIEIINSYVGKRKSRFHRPGRAFEETYYTFDILADIGAYRDLQRHRILTQEHQTYSVKHGYIVSPELQEANLESEYREVLDKTGEVTQLIAREFPNASQYLVPFAYRIRWRIKLNLREVYHFVELRSSRQGHPSYRAIAQDMYRQIQEVHPTLAAGMSFVDLNNYDLARLAAEQKLDRKLKEL